MLTVEKEAIIVAFRECTLLRLDDRPFARRPTMPRLTRSPLHRRLQRCGISRLPEVEGGKASGRSKFTSYPIGTREPIRTVFTHKVTRHGLRRGNSRGSRRSAEP